MLVNKKSKYLQLELVGSNMTILTNNTTSSGLANVVDKSKPKERSIRQKQYQLVQQTKLDHKQDQIITYQQLELYDRLRLSYMDYLTYLGLYKQQKEVSTFLIDQYILNDSNSFSFKSIFYPAKMICTICQEPITFGLVIYCYKCYHGGHFNHMKQWFTYNNDCPAGCSCTCKDYIPDYF